MLRYIFPILAIFIFSNCNNPQDKTPPAKERDELVPEPDKDLREKYEAEQRLKASGCIFSDPDTSLGNLKLRGFRSTQTVISDKDKIDSNGQYHFYSANHRETLTLMQHPGDGNYQVSIFKIEFSDKTDQGYKTLNIEGFQTEKGIRLGLSKSQIIEKLGNCYIAKDSSEGYIELQYWLVAPDDSKTGILRTHNMPIYYAIYRFWKERLEKFEFGFEYP